MFSFMIREKIEYYLKNWQERKAVARKGYEKVQKFTVENWARFIIEKATIS